MKLEEIKKLAKLARIDMSEEEMSGIAQDFDSILAYVGQVQEASLLIKDKNIDFNNPVENVMREDVATSNPAEYADSILEEMPEKEGRYLKVKQIL